MTSEVFWDNAFARIADIKEAKEMVQNRLEGDEIKTSAIRALGYYQDKAAIPFIEKYLDSKYVGVRKEAKKVIDRLNKL